MCNAYKGKKFCESLSDTEIQGHLNLLQLFPWERQVYNKTEIGIHRRIGDKDASSHRGHPLCEYCDTRFFDKDALYKHLRTEHFFCHICDADGSNDFYE